MWLQVERGCSRHYLEQRTVLSIARSPVHACDLDEHPADPPVASPACRRGRCELSSEAGSPSPLAKKRWHGPDSRVSQAVLDISSAAMLRSLDRSAIWQCRDAVCFVCPVLDPDGDDQANVAGMASVHGCIGARRSLADLRQFGTEGTVSPRLTRRRAALGFRPDGAGAGSADLRQPCGTRRLDVVTLRDRRREAVHHQRRRRRTIEAGLPDRRSSFSFDRRLAGA